MSAWDDYFGGNGSAVAGSSGARQFNDGGVGLPSNIGGVYHPTPAGVGPAQQDDSRPGSISINPLDPGSTSTDPISQLFDGMRQGLFGGNEDTAQGKASREHSLFGGIPLVGDVGRGVSNLGGGAGEVFGGAVGAVGGGLERVHVGTEGENKGIDDEYAAIDPEFRKQFDEAIAKEKGLFGTGLLDNDYHWKSVAIREWRKDQSVENPTFNPGAFSPPGSLADALTNMFDVMGVAAAGAERVASGVENVQGNDRLDQAMALVDGQASTGFLGTGFLAGQQGATEVEKLAVAKVRNKDWTRDEALDFLSSHGAGWGHDPVQEVFGSFAGDPLNIATFGAGAVAKVGAKGALMASRFETAAAKVAEVAKVLDEAVAAREAATGTRAIKLADRAVEAARADLKVAGESMEAIRAFRSGTSIRKINALARAAEGRESVGATMRFIGKAYAGLEGTSIGRAAKITRTIIDPLHALDLHIPGVARTVDLLSDSIPRSVADTMGVHHYKGILDDALRLDSSRGMYDQITRDIAVASTNMGREGVVDMFRANHMAGKLGEELMKTLPDDVFETAVATTRHRDLQKWLRTNTVKHVLQESWSTFDHQTLANGLEQAYHSRTAAEWMELLPKLSKEQKSLYKFAVYGSANRGLLDLVANMAPEVAAKLPVSPGRMVLLAKGTLTRVGGESLLTKLTKARTLKSKLKLIADAQEKYPSLRYVTMNPAALERSVDQFIQHLENGLDRLPMQLTKDELKVLGDEGESLRSVIGEYSLGFRPSDEFLWGLERENSTGLYRAATGAWADHVADGAMAYRPARALRVNIAGHPIVGIPLVRIATKAVDHMDSAARLMKTQVSSAMVQEAARKRFVGIASRDFAEHGVTESVAHDWFERITEYTREHQGYSGPRGMSGDDLYGAIKNKGLIPQSALSGAHALRPEDILLLTLRAFDGDMRYIGLTQKLSSRLKTMLSLGGTNNFAGQIAEHAWPTIKFRYNPIFQLQEKIEPWVLNAQRGVSFATGVTLSEADAATERLLLRMTDNDLVRQADIDLFEQSSAVLFGKSTTRTASTPGTRLAAIRRVGHALGDVQGMKRINMLRTFRKGLGKELRASWEEARPGDWEKMKEAADLRAGRILDEDDFALQIVSENAYANDVFVERVLGKAGKFGKVDFANAVKTGAWHTPTTLGELKALDLEHMASSLRLTTSTGEDVKDLNSLRAALATDPDMMDKVLDGLKVLGADPDYIRRTQNALNFSWGGFWKAAEKRFSLTGDESRRLQDMMAGAASLRNMTPVEFMSQVFSPMLIEGTEGVLGSLEGHVRILRDARAAGRKIKPREAKLAETRTQLAGKEGVSTRDDLVRQLAGTFSAHLDPSAKRALLLEFKPELQQAVLDGKIKFDLQEIEDLWDDLAENQLADRILGYMDGKPPAHAASELDSARGVASVRDAAARYMRQRGVEPLGGRPHFKLDADMEAHYEEGARHFRDLPDVEYEKTGRVPNAAGLSKSDLNLKPQPAGVDDATYRAYQSFVQDTRAQYDFMVQPKAKGGLGLKVVVSRKDPYTADAAGRAAMVKDMEKGVLKVFGGSSDHALMTNEQNVMFRAVHDVFGHAAEGFEFGPRGELNAAAKHARMYSNEGRPAMLTETHGQTSYVNYSDDIYQPEATQAVHKPLDMASPAEDFEARYPFDMPEHQRAMLGPDDPREATVVLKGADEYGVEGSFTYAYSQRIGDGIHSLPPEQQAALLQPIADLFEEFPNLRIHHIDAVPFSHPLVATDTLHGMGFPDAYAITWGADDAEPVIIFNSDWLERIGTDWSGQDFVSKGSAQSPSFTQRGPNGPIEVPRKSNYGAPHNAGDLDIAQVQRHEAGHAFDVARRPHRSSGNGRWEQRHRTIADKPYSDMMARFEQAAGRLDLSEYGMKSSAEFAAELFSFATDPKLVTSTIKSPELRDMVEEFQQFLKDSGEWKPVAAAADPMAGKTIREVNAAKRGTVYAPQKAGLLPQAYLDEFTDRFVGRSKHVESNPDVARTAQMFGKWTDAVVTNGLLKGENSVFSGLLHDVAGIPTKEAVPYNYTEGAAVNLAMSSMTRKWDDAFRLQYFSQERSFFERSLNHPMFGMYPASYMWGKIMPELIRTIATNPFGLKTGGGLRTAMDIQASIALRRQYDPEFDAKIEEMGHSQALSFLGYMMPSLPWDIQAGAPAWMTSIAEQGLRNTDADRTNDKNVGVLDPAVDSLKKLAPLTTTVPWLGRAIDEANGPADVKEARKDVVDHQKAVHASELQPTMSRIMGELQDALR